MPNNVDEPEPTCPIVDSPNRDVVAAGKLPSGSFNDPGVPHLPPLQGANTRPRDRPIE